MSEDRVEAVVRADSGPVFSRGRIAVTCVAAVALAAVVGLASSGAPWRTGGTAGRAHLPAIVGDILGVVLVMLVCTGGMLAWLLAALKGAERRASRGGRSSLVTVLVGTTVAVVAIAATITLLGSGGRRPPGPVAAVGGKTAGPAALKARDGGVNLDWLLLAAVGALGVVVGALVVRRRLAQVDLEPADAPPGLVRAIADSIEDIERESDPRRAVIRAYARMEHGLGNAGLTRARYETPFEFVSRSLQRLSVSAASAHGLAELFERARFSLHPIDRAGKQAAIGALRDVQAELDAQA
jgi:hypothetical protein